MILYKTSEYRPCIICKNKALFHRWQDVSRVIEPSPMVGGHPGGEVKYTVGIVEYEDGTIHECHPYEVRFISTYHDGYCWEGSK